MRVDLMFNDFIIVGPSDDPAGILGLTNGSEVFQRLYQKRDSITFISRGDNSGTHVKELSLWENAGIEIKGDDIDWVNNNSWYIETGAGMTQTLITASELGGYTLTDRGTWLFTKHNLQLVVLAENKQEWKNQYGVILVNPDKFQAGSINFKVAKDYVKWLISDRGQDLIDSYLINGEQAFFANFKDHIDEMSEEELEFWGIGSGG